MSEQAGSTGDVPPLHFPFELDPFQVEAIQALTDHQVVLVSAPTSAGKTVVAEAALDAALHSGRRSVYTTPLKALSNQKFRDFGQRWGQAAVGLVTGETTINADAPVVVMTTEILRNQIYEAPQRLDALSVVVMDEIHYIDDYPRGTVWEEVILQAPRHIQLLGLSATVSNVAELAAWMERERGPVKTVVVERRPVPLRLWLAIHGRLEPLLDEHGAVPGRTWRLAAAQDRADAGRWRRAPRFDLPRLVLELEGRGWLPAIVFIFSRKGCEEALRRARYRNLDLTSAAEKQQIHDVYTEWLAGLRDPDEAALLRRQAPLDPLRRGLAVHHAGLFPTHKELVEELFAAGLLKVVYATETLALGIHMPARSVVISSFTKFDGVEFAPVKAGELSQMLGRAGRRGLDAAGHGVVVHEGDVDIETIAEAATSPDAGIVSKFAPTYNMVLNLLARQSPEAARRLLERSFGAFQQGPEAGYGEQLSAIMRVLRRTGFLRGERPTKKGSLAARLYGEHPLLLAEALEEGWLEGLSPAELNASLAMLTGEERGKPRDLAGRRMRLPTPALHAVWRRWGRGMAVLVRAEREADLDTLRPLSAQFVEPLFAWSLGASWEELPIPAGAALGDVVRAARNLYSLLRQLDRALAAGHPLMPAVREGRRAMERDLLMRV